MCLHLTTLQAETLEEAATPPGQVLHHGALYVHLELKQVNLLPVGPVQGEDVPGFAHLKIIIDNCKILV